MATESLPVSDELGKVTKGCLTRETQVVAVTSVHERNQLRKGHHVGRKQSHNLDPAETSKEVKTNIFEVSQTRCSSQPISQSQGKLS